MPTTPSNGTQINVTACSNILYVTVMEVTGIIIRAAHVSDVADMHRVQNECYPKELHESPEVFASMLSCPGAFCYVAIDASQACMGYLVAHLWHDLCNPPPLHITLTDLEDCGKAPTCCFIHDTAVLPRFRRMGVARLLLKRLHKDLATCNQAHLPFLLVAVGNASSYWKQWGFAVEKTTCSPEILATFGKRPIVMSCVALGVDQEVLGGSASMPSVC